ncbi:hypothetical protein FB45DRAFT_123546 [Roridomyces roridus]|uniref:Uncharacterized protein n=1 Tax=Roridomyces roridus TaxID=1738132 RepID=A0AAD7FG89_9AGAR|nr:hypothetical protein FB45DRAFT_123546 [Roridomyces roridus]
MDSPVPRAVNHHLLQEERSRLIRSTRKIQEVVGETPQVVDVTALPAFSSSSARRWASKITKRTRNRNSLHHDLPALPATASPASDAIRPTLYLSVPDEPYPEQLVLPTPPPSPTLTVALNLPNVGDYLVKDDVQARRRKMSKLFRTLGTNVPPELVFPPTATTTTTANRNDIGRVRRRLTARTVLSDHGDSVKSGKSGKSSVRSKGAAIDHWRSAVGVGSGLNLAPPSPALSFKGPERERLTVKPRGPRAARAQAKSAFKKPPLPPPPPHTEPVEPISRGWVWVGRAQDVPPRVRLRMQRGAEKTSRHSNLMDDLAFTQLRVPEPEDNSANSSVVAVKMRDAVEEDEQQTPSSTFRAMYRWQNDWNGNWVGAGNMDDVLQSLRDLKIK